MFHFHKATKLFDSETVSIIFLREINELKGVQKKTCFFFQKYFGFLKMFFLLTKSFGCQRKSFRYRPKEHFDTCLRSVGRIFTEIWHFSWQPTIWTSIFLQFLTLLYVVLTWISLTENGITQWLWILQTWDRCQNFPWFKT